MSSLRLVKNEVRVRHRSAGVCCLERPTAIAAGRGLLDEPVAEWGRNHRATPAAGRIYVRAQYGNRRGDEPVSTLLTAALLRPARPDAISFRHCLCSWVQPASGRLSESRARQWP